MKVKFKWHTTHFVVHTGQKIQYLNSPPQKIQRRKKVHQLQIEKYQFYFHSLDQTLSKFESNAYGLSFNNSLITFTATPSTNKTQNNAGNGGKKHFFWNLLASAPPFSYDHNLNFLWLSCISGGSVFNFTSIGCVWFVKMSLVFSRRCCLLLVVVTIIFEWWR